MFGETLCGPLLSKTLKAQVKLELLAWFLDFLQPQLRIENGTHKKKEPKTNNVFIFIFL